MAANNTNLNDIINATRMTATNDSIKHIEEDMKSRFSGQRFSMRDDALYEKDEGFSDEVLLYADFKKGCVYINCDDDWYNYSIPLDVFIAFADYVKASLNALATHKEAKDDTQD